VILTGASHTGKTTVARAILESVPAPAAYLSVDDILETTIAKPSGSIWAEIPLAYDLLKPQLAMLLDRDWFIVLESTFTYVPTDGAGQFHATQLSQMINVARRCAAPWLLIQLATEDTVTRKRSDRTGRLPSDIVEKTIELHRNAVLPKPSRRLEVSDETPAQIARRVLGEFAKSSRLA
jgi:chloramphenicol 3-O-phosphotransferase